MFTVRAESILKLHHRFGAGLRARGVCSSSPPCGGPGSVNFNVLSRSNVGTISNIILFLSNVKLHFLNVSSKQRNAMEDNQSVLFLLAILPPNNFSLLLTNEPYSPWSTDHPPSLLLTSLELKTKEETNT